MGRRSRFDTMPKALLDQVNALIRQGRTIGEIREHMATLGEDIPNGTAGRYVQKVRNQMARYREAQEIAGQWVAQLGENPQGDVGALLAEMLKTVAFQTISTMGGDGDDDDEDAKAAAKPMDIMLLAKAIKDLEDTAKRNLERREKIERTVLERQAKATEATAKQLGLSEEGWERIRAKFLGIPVPESV
ncbi:MAG: DUF3486 family protein [Pseudoxanthomonas sp.]|uniref:phage protein Gp27 family protein n=1 Tax=Pseudoxanthomonas sp. TaxID=1871049 RepID=UPI00258E9D42|nr:phage protein Gp27 family protein [Pseudoxanthomonas sp.]MCH2092717.1 DUF3486 family protein [Pseudoxanthomonas sp.]